MANRWTKKEDKILIKNIEENYDNLTIAFKKTALELEKTFDGCRLRWYGKLRNDNLCFASISERKAYKNRKTLPKNYAKDYVKMTKKKSKLKVLISNLKRLFVLNALVLELYTLVCENECIFNLI